MGNNAEGRICYGIKLEQDYEFPWAADKHDGDIEDWWIYAVCGYQDPFPLYKEDGNFLDGPRPSEERLNAYYHPKWAFQKSHPVPVSLVNYGGGYILAVPGSLLSGEWGDPVEFNPAKLVVTADQRQALIDFYQKYCMPTDEYTDVPVLEPKWYLRGYWG